MAPSPSSSNPHQTQQVHPFEGDGTRAPGLHEALHAGHSQAGEQASPGADERQKDDSSLGGPSDEVQALGRAEGIEDLQAPDDGCATGNAGHGLHTKCQAGA